MKLAVVKTMSKSKVFIGIAISFGIGILIASKFFIPTQAVYIFLGLCAGGFALAFFSNNNRAVLAALFLFCAGLGAFRLQLAILPNQFQDLLDNKQQLEGYVVEGVDIRANHQLITFHPKGYSQNILITATLGQEFFYGDMVAVDGKLVEAKNFAQPQLTDNQLESEENQRGFFSNLVGIFLTTGAGFDYQKYLERYNVYATIAYPKILILKSHQLNPIKELLLKVKDAFTHRTSELFKEPQSSLLLGILIGAKKTLPQDIVDNFNRTGTSHIIAVSGFNITIIISALASLAYVVGRRVSFYLALGTIVSFVIIAGASASVLRAAIMGFLLLLALNIGRQYAIVPSIFFAGLVMLIINPKILFWDVGFQLSFAATLGIIYFLPVLNQLFQNLPQALGAKTLILTTLSAIVATLPIILFNFGTLSLSAPLVNLLILPAVPATMLFGFLAILPFVGSGFAFIANWLLIYILKITAFFASLPYSSLNFQISVWTFWGLMAGVFGVYFLLKRAASLKAT